VGTVKDRGEWDLTQLRIPPQVTFDGEAEMRVGGSPYYCTVVEVGVVVPQALADEEGAQSRWRPLADVSNRE